ncbi:hypothetical protein F2Q68_00030407 [Brassica cretica]|uniref:Uncharacterized protein n=1 Tax=Brassica cretica TaxID=69181 RepID=A0A8S9G4I6_BRACR|nr:hypothetical protein F2Q68_00030407 [Brassica cretica]
MRVFDTMPRDVRDQCAGLRVIRAKMADSHRKRFYALGRRSLRGLLHNHCGISCGMTAFSDVTEGKERLKPASRRAKNK